ncbi:hypothetical protein [Gracilibacillus timonensis]|uniref:hypothetical protein n=1 Tax=Gracilibacillus timonensis TaxID=1816696 RepID=UPI0008240BC4|nr:hypothetical protein [Gracilibacillus timonensis]
MRRRRLNKQSKRLILLSIVLVILILLFVFLLLYLFSDERQAVKVADTFYQHEQQGDFGDSWGLFHSSMKERFSKSEYVQDRAHVFLEHFGVTAFDYQLSEAEKVKDYQVNENTSLQTAYRLTATYIYESKYGYLEISQPVFLVQEEGEWCVTWEYNQ